MAEGDLTTRLQLRPRDELKNIRDSFNNAIGSLHARVTLERGRAKEIKQLIEQVVVHPDLHPAEAAALNRALASLRPQASTTGPRCQRPRPRKPRRTPPPHRVA